MVRAWKGWLTVCILHERCKSLAASGTACVALVVLSGRVYPRRVLCGRLGMFSAQLENGMNATGKLCGVFGLPAWCRVDMLVDAVLLWSLHSIPW
jgi:hypothetical protein